MRCGVEILLERSPGPIDELPNSAPFVGVKGLESYPVGKEPRHEKDSTSHL
jgi:hypothetical protein